MKTFCSLSIFILLLFIGSAPIQAQKMSPSKTNTTRFLPVKKVVLLHEITEVSKDQILQDSNDLEMDFLEDRLTQQTFDLNVLLHLFSIHDIAKIHVKVGTKPGASDFAQHSFLFDQKNEKAEPFIYTRDGKTVVLGMGKTSGINDFYVEVILEGIKGQRSEPRYFGSRQ